MKKLVTMFALVFLMAIMAMPVAADADNNACWGQATAVFAQMGEMGEHASQQPTPKLGLRNLAPWPTQASSQTTACSRWELLSPANSI